MHRAPNLEFDPWVAEPRPAPRRCDHPECAEAGAYRAPKGRDRLADYFWFCLEHVRAYNLSWNYFAGMNEAEIERIRRRDTVWDRPSWPLSGGVGPMAGRATHRFHNGAYNVRDFFELFDEEAEPRAPARRPSTPEDEALAVFALHAPVTLLQVKARYKELVKRHHPDRNGGDPAAEERLKVINQAYTTLKGLIAA
ncbi:MAG TPA: J domain-containing protein [Alphaproteobacteria bacterium]|nr:J domain-containing protein [Alphaproteobacteria bacterium]